MPQFVHLHVHTQYSILDGQASIQRLVDKAMADGQPGIAVTDHGDMFGIKEFYNYVQKVKGKCKDKAAEAEARIAALRDGTETCADPAAEIAKCERQLEECRRKLAFKPIIGCEVYVARRRLHDKEGKPDQSGYHLILLAKNLKGYHNLIKIVSKAWTEGFYMRPRTDRTEIEKYHEGLICCSACLAGEVPRAITANDLANVRKGGDYVAQMIEMAGGDYVFADLTDNGNNLSTMNLPLEDFYAGAKDADVLLYNSTIEGVVHTTEELVAKCPLLAEFKAVQSGSVWCTTQSFFQQSTALVDFVLDLHRVFTENDPADLQFLRKVE